MKTSTIFPTISSTISHSFFTLVILFIASSNIFAQTTPDLQTAESFSVLAGGEVNATAAVGTKQDAGAATSISPNVEAEGREFEGGDCIVTTALTDLETARQQLAAQSGIAIPANIANITLTPGVRETTGSLDVSGTVTLTGSATDVFIFNIKDDLTLANSAKIELNGVESRNVYFNVEGETKLEANAEINGRVLSKKTITCEVGFKGEMVLHSLEDVVIKDACTVGIEKPTQPSINLGLASSFALLAASSISDSDTVAVFGDMGVFKGSISNHIHASGITFPTNSCDVQKALSDLSFAFSAAYKLPSTPIAGNLSGQLGQGVYDIKGSATLKGILTLTGNASSVYVFRVSDELNVAATSILNLGNVKPENVYWIVANKTTILDAVDFSGTVITRGDIVKSGTNKGQTSFMSLFGSIAFKANNWDPTRTHLFSRDELIKVRPPVQLDISDCGALDVELATVLKTETTADATQYEFLVTNAALAYSKSAIVSPGGSFYMASLDEFPDPNTTYNIKVRERIGTMVSEYGSSCQVTTGTGFEKGRLWGMVADPSAKAISGSRSSNSTLNSIFNNFDVTSYEQAFPFAKTPELLDAYEIICDCDEEQLRIALEQNASSLLTDIIKIKKPIPLYDPADYMWQLLLQGTDWMWSLEKIQANLAWDITLGDPNIKIAIIDTDFDIAHPDLAGKIDPTYDPYTNIPFNQIFVGSGISGHGTSVASLAAGETAETGQTANGQMPSVGFKCEIIGYRWDSGLQKGLHASTVMNADIISISWFNGCSPNTYDELVVKEILDNGTVICGAAGNGPQHCGGGPIFPFSAVYDDRLIQVTSTDRDDNHTAPNGGTTHSSYPEIDICAPGYGVMVASVSGGSSWPYYGSGSGTSLATPIVAGVVGLMLSVNPCLRPGDVQAIIKATADPITDAASYPGELGAGRINAFKAVQMAETYSTTTQSITTDTDWTGDEFITGDINVEAGATLSITSMVFMSEDARINVKRGGKLVIDGGTITTNCPLSWHGIEVWGNSSLAQPSLSQVINGSYPSTSTDHAVIIIKNNSLIEYMHEGISTHRRDQNFNSIWNYTGGIILAENSTFRNNRRAVEFMAFTASDQISSFKNCTFETTDALLESTSNPSAFVTLWNVNGVKFLGNDFINTTTGIYDYNKRGKGIFSADAGYIVEPYCHPMLFPCKVENHFEGLFRGIEALSCVDPLKYLKIEENEFENNLQGVLIGGVNNAEIVNNKFEIGSAVNNVDYPYGLYLSGSTGYWVEANEFTSFASSYLTTGTFIRNSGDDYNEIYANVMDNVHGGTVTLDDNDGSTVMDGLHIKCNDNTNNYYDIVVRDGDIGYIQGMCGTSNGPAGNQFSHTCIQNKDNELYVAKSDPQLIYYFQHQESLSTPPFDRTELQCYNTSFVIPLGCAGAAFDPLNSCPSPFTGCSGGNLPCKKVNLDIATAQLAVASTGLDGGNTQGLKDAINNPAPLTPGQLRTLLVGASPLSLEVLITFIDRTVATNPPGLVKEVLGVNAPVNTEVLLRLFELATPLPHGIFKDIMIESSPLTNLTLNKIGDMNPQLPKGILNNIMNHQSDPFVVSVRQQLIWDIASLGAERGRLFEDLIRGHLSDESFGGLDEVISLLEGEGTVKSKERLVSAYNKKEDFTKSLQMLNDLSALPEYSEFVKLQTVIIDILKNGTNKNLFDLAGSNEQIVRGVAAQDGAIGSVNAQTALEFLFSEIHPEKFFLPDTVDTTIHAKMAGNSNIPQQEEVDFGVEEITDIQNAGYTLSNYPNPFSDGTIIGAFVPNKTSTSEVIVYNVVGNTVARYDLNPGHNFIEITSGEINHGIYFYTLISNGSKIETRKMIHLK